MKIWDFKGIEKNECSLLLKLPNKGMSFPFPPLKLLNKGNEEYSKIIIFIHFHYIPFFPSKWGLKVNIRHLVPIWIRLILRLCFHFFFWEARFRHEKMGPVGPMYCSQDPQISFFNKISIKMGLTALFTHLKIILLQCFQFSVFSFKQNKRYPNTSKL